jgi:transposase
LVASAWHSADYSPRRTRTTRPNRGRPVSYDTVAYRARNVVERCIGWLKEWRSVATRFDKLAVSYLQTVKLAFLMRYLRLLS